jgi:HTH-type transcriptional regulator/antitoxin HigA
MAVYSKEGKMLYSAIAIPAGEILKDELQARGIKQKDFARDINMSVTQLNEILAGKRGISPELACILESALSIKAEFWNKLQADYELTKARLDEQIQHKVKQVAIWSNFKKYINVTFLNKQGVLSDNLDDNIQKVKEIFKINSIDDLIDIFTNIKFVKFRKSNKLQTDQNNLITWIKFVEYLADKKDVNQFDTSKKDELIQALKKAFLGEKVIENTESCLSKYGIKLIIQDKPAKVNVDGITFWSGQNPVIVITLRYKRIDNFVFNVLHELGHIFLHFQDKEVMKIDIFDEKLKVDTEEKEANQFAKNALIEQKTWSNFITQNKRFDELIIFNFAKSVGVHPAIVKGRLCNEGLIPYSACNTIPHQIL